LDHDACRRVESVGSHAVPKLCLAAPVVHTIGVEFKAWRHVASLGSCVGYCVGI